MKQLTVLSVPVHCETSEEFISHIQSWLRSFSTQRTRTIFAINPEKIMRARSDHFLREALLGADLLIPDGVGVVMAVRVLYGMAIQRTTGIGLVEELLSLAAKRGWRFFFFGSTQAVLEGMKARFGKDLPAVQVVGDSHGFVAEDDHEALIARINASRAEILLVGLGSPRQEIWLHRYRERLKVRICLGVGGSFDVLAGHVKRAPQGFQRLGLEWLYRLLSDFRRFRRQLVLPQFAFMVFCEKMQRFFNKTSAK